MTKQGEEKRPKKKGERKKFEEKYGRIPQTKVRQEVNRKKNGLFTTGLDKRQNKEGIMRRREV